MLTNKNPSICLNALLDGRWHIIAKGEDSKRAPPTNKPSGRERVARSPSTGDASSFPQENRAHETALQSFTLDIMLTRVEDVFARSIRIQKNIVLSANGNTL